MSAAVALFEVFPAAVLPAALMCGINTDTRAGGKVTGSTVDGPGCLERYWRSTVISSCKKSVKISTVVYWRRGMLEKGSAGRTYGDFCQLGVLFSEEGLELELPHAGQLHLGR